ncbi:MAG: cob(I)yrinic acid a,c-diamide adenosyltransferase [Patescibacteria group bacterium]
MKTKFFTGKGDQGESQIGEKKFSKTDPAMAILGTLDELNSWLGLCRAKINKEKNFSFEKGDPLNLENVIKEIQQLLFIAQAEVAAIAFAYPKSPKITSATTEKIEGKISLIDQQVSELKHFIIPGGSEISAMFDFGRTIIRRAEREAVGYNSEIKRLTPELLQFFNRLSSFLFALARYANFQLKIEEDRPNYQ